MNVFVLCTGRCGSVTFSKACSHLTNYTAGHESRYRCLSADRMQFPDQHIEVDLRLAWYPGLLDVCYGNQAFYVHLWRDPELVADSYVRRFNRRQKAMSRSWYEMLGKPDPALLPDVMLDMVTVMNSNIDFYLRDKEFMTIDISMANTRFLEFCDRVGAVGDMDHALAEFNVYHNADKIEVKHDDNQSQH